MPLHEARCDTGAPPASRVMRFVPPSLKDVTDVSCYERCCATNLNTADVECWAALFCAFSCTAIIRNDA